MRTPGADGELARGSCAACFPGPSVWVTLEDFDPQCRTPAYRSVPVQVECA